MRDGYYGHVTPLHQSQLTERAATAATAASTGSCTERLLLTEIL